MRDGGPVKWQYRKVSSFSPYSLLFELHIIFDTIPYCAKGADFFFFIGAMFRQQDVYQILSTDTPSSH